MGQQNPTKSKSQSSGAPHLGHNRPHLPAEELAAELAVLQEAERKTSLEKLKQPELVDYVYEVRFYPGASLISGELKAYDMRHARRVLNVILGVTRLPVDTKIIEKAVVEREWKEISAVRNRKILKILTVHHHWLQGMPDGKRADMSGEDLEGANLAGRNLSMVSLANANLSGASLRGAVLVGADMSGADLSNADLSGADLTNASLAEANLIGADLSKVQLKSTDFWRANLSRAKISPETLHQALGCQQ
ncbi:pentapeptide repeat-containing protein [Sneathiella glossodoripedis]|uniref:pentapeptide repeat-containing protein n=1 Tax=Sneathiella glossodoripedis TaxID=418853 RepID=UPI0004700F1A|nr:pentapeptide repeat-containing protein [Sneathiella glossodoripedis]